MNQTERLKDFLKRKRLRFTEERKDLLGLIETMGDHFSVSDLESESTSQGLQIGKDTRVDLGIHSVQRKRRVHEHVSSGVQVSENR